MAAQYRIGVIGHTGKGNYGHGIDSVWRDVPGCETVAVADPHEGGRAAAMKRLSVTRGFADYRKLLDEVKPDIVSICPRWLDQHRDMVVAAAQRGIHIYMEKPFCRTLAEADEIVAVCEKKNVKLAIAFQTRYGPKIQVISDMIEQGQIGELVELRGRGKEDRRGGGEDLWVLGSHIMNLIHHFAGEPNWCMASVQQGDRTTTKEDVKEGPEGIGPLAGDNISAMYGLDGGATAYFGTRKAGGPGGSGKRFGLRIHGTAGVIDIVTGYLPAVYYLPDPYWSTARTAAKWIPVSSQGPGKPEPLTETSHHAGNVAACKDLIEAIEDDRQPEASMYEARTSVEMIVAVFESLRLAGPAAMPLKNRENPLAMLK